MRLLGAKTLRDTQPKTEADFFIENYGSILLLRPVNDSARLWVEENIRRDNGFQPYFPTVVIEHRYVADIIVGIQQDGLAVGI